MRIMFASLLGAAWASGRQRMAAFQSLGHEVIPFPLDEFDQESAFARKLRLRLHGPFFRAAMVERAGRAFTSAAQGLKPDLVWVEKALVLTSHWLAAARAATQNTTFVCFQDDDPFGFRTRERPLWANFIQAIPEYDVHFVKKAANVTDFERHGAKRALIFMHGVHTPWFHPRASVPAWAQKEVVFVGTPLDHRVDQISRLFGCGVPLDVYGDLWPRHAVYWRHRRRFHGAIMAERYATLLAASKIGLGFVSSSNRDEYSMRTFEIPGSASLLLAERTPTHQELFTEGAEAEFFGSPEECADKCKYYLRHEHARERVAKAGYERCMRSGYSLEHRMQSALNELSVVTRQAAT